MRYSESEVDDGDPDGTVTGKEPNRFFRWLSGEDDMSSMVADSQYYVSSGDWPAGAADDDVPIDKAREVLGEFDQYYNAALEGLARTQLPMTDESGRLGP